MCFCVNLDSSKKHFDALKNVDKSVLAGSNILNCLKEVRVTIAYGKLLRILTERRMPNPAKMTFAGGNACNINMSMRTPTRICGETYQASTRFKNRGEGLQDIHSWVKQFGPSFIAIRGLFKSLDLLLKDGDNSIGGVTGLEPGHEKMGKQIFFCALSVLVQGVIYD